MIWMEQSFRACKLRSAKGRGQWWGALKVHRRFRTLAGLSLWLLRFYTKSKKRRAQGEAQIMLSPLAVHDFGPLI